MAPMLCLRHEGRAFCFYCRADMCIIFGTLLIPDMLFYVLIWSIRLRMRGIFQRGHFMVERASPSFILPSFRSLRRFRSFRCRSHLLFLYGFVFGWKENRIMRASIDPPKYINLCILGPWKAVKWRPHSKVEYRHKWNKIWSTVAEISNASGYNPEK